MKKFFKEKSTWILSGIAIILVVLCLMSSFAGGFLRNLSGIVAKPFRTASTAITDFFGGIGDRFQSVEDLQAENEALRKQVADLERQVRQQQADSDENIRLRRLLDLEQQRSDLTFVSASVVQRPSANWSVHFTLNKGTNAGITVGCCVTDEYAHLVGVVADAGYNWSTVTAITDTESSIGAMVHRTRDLAVAEGELVLMAEKKLALNYLEEDVSLLSGDVVVTSGLGGYYPAGLTIGSVESVATDDSGMNRYAVIAPGADFANIKQMFVVTDFDVVE